MSKDFDEKTLHGVIGSILAAADVARQQDPEYLKLFDEDSLDGLLRQTENAMMTVALNCTAVLDRKHGIKGNEVFRLVIGLPLVAHLLEKQIEETQGSVCCTDKTFYALCETLRALKMRAEAGAKDGSYAG